MEQMDSDGRPDSDSCLDGAPQAARRGFHDELVALLPHLRAYARFLARNSDLADDIVQDTVVRMLRSEGHYRPSGHFKAWAFTILRNCFYSQFRRKDHGTASLDQELAEGRGAQNGDQEGTLAFRDFHRAFWALPESHREVLMLVGRSGFTYEDAAKLCGCQIGTIKSRISRARHDLRQSLKE